MVRGRCIRSSKYSAKTAKTSKDEQGRGKDEKSKGQRSNPLTLPFFLVIVSRFRKNVPGRVSYAGNVGQPGQCEPAKAESQGRVKFYRPSIPGYALILRGARESSHRCPRVSPPWRAMRAGISETESAPDQGRLLGWTRDHRPGSRLEVERRQTRSSNLGFSSPCANLRAGRERLKTPARGCRIWALSVLG